MSAETFLSHLDKVRQTGPGRWIACCPAHDDKHPSFNIRELDDGRVLINCKAGCSTEEILSSVGMTFSDLYPPNDLGHCKSERRPFPASDILKAIGFEALVVCSSAVTILDGKPFSQADRDRLILATSRIQAGLSATGIKHG